VAEDRDKIIDEEEDNYLVNDFVKKVTNSVNQH
jgi:hypothetical protein